MADFVEASQQRQNVKSKRRKQLRTSERTKPIEESISESQVKYFRELRRLWEDAS